MVRIDSHQHFWRYNPTEHIWMSDTMSAIRRDFLPQDLEPLLAASGFDASIAVQARQSLEETRWLLELAEGTDFICGVVGWVDLCSEGLASQLEALVSNGKLAGVRHVLQDEPDPEFMMRPEFLRGISRLSDFDLTYDLLIYPRHLPTAARLVRQFPQQRFVLDHIAKPNVAERRLSPWREDLQALAAFPNVSCKLSGMVTEAEWKRWRPEDFDPYLDTVFEAFGAERLMIGSDWPVCTLAADYRSTMQIVVEYFKRWPHEQQAAVLGGNCKRIYKRDFPSGEN